MESNENYYDYYANNQDDDVPEVQQYVGNNDGQYYQNEQYNAQQNYTGGAGKFIFK